MAQSFFILGCGKMGSALLNGWLAGGLGQTYRFTIIDPFFDEGQITSAYEAGQICQYETLGQALQEGAVSPDVMLLSVKPQIMAEALSQAQGHDLSSCCFISIAAGLSLAKLEDMIGAAKTPRLIRTMPNTPAAIGKGITAIIGNEVAGPDDIDLAEALLSACGAVVRLADEEALDAVTALSGSGPAYVFLMAEAMMKAGESLGLSEDLSRQLAIQTLYGASSLLADSHESADVLRENVTSKGGTTAAALDVLMTDDRLSELMREAMSAAHKRSRELGK